MATLSDVLVGFKVLKYERSAGLSGVCVFCSHHDDGECKLSLSNYLTCSRHASCVFDDAVCPLDDPEEVL